MHKAPWECGTAAAVNRRTALKLATATGLPWLTPVAELLAQQSPASRGGRPPQSVILLWLAGGPSQLETFDPHPDSKMAAGSTAIETSVPGIQLGSGLPRVAELMHELTIIRNVVSREGDHERATYQGKTGFRPDPTLVHPSLGAILCHQLPAEAAEVPRHISLMPNQWYGRGGHLGDRYDAFRVDDPKGDLPDMVARVGPSRFAQRLADLEVVERGFNRGRPADLDRLRTNHQTGVGQAVKMMDSAQLDAFDISRESLRVQEDFGDSDFGRSCLMAMRLIEVGVRCVEVTLDGWDSHVANHDIHAALVPQLDAGLAALIRNLRDRDRLRDTLIVCGGEFGRTPDINPAGGRDHWPHGYSTVLVGGNLRGGLTWGETDPEGLPLGPTMGTSVQDIHATILHALGIPYETELPTSVGRPIRLSEGQPLTSLLQ